MVAKMFFLAPPFSWVCLSASPRWLSIRVSADTLWLLTSRDLAAGDWSDVSEGSADDTESREAPCLHAFYRCMKTKLFIIYMLLLHEGKSASFSMLGWCLKWIAQEGSISFEARGCSRACARFNLYTHMAQVVFENWACPDCLQHLRKAISPTRIKTFHKAMWNCCLCLLCVFTHLDIVETDLRTKSALSSPILLWRAVGPWARQSLPHMLHLPHAEDKPICLYIGIHVYISGTWECKAPRVGDFGGCRNHQCYICLPGNRRL